MSSDYDGAWKDFLHRRLADAVNTYFPRVGAAIDWNSPVAFLDQELRELLITDLGSGNRVDLLARVRMNDASSRTLHMHIEVQSSREEGFARRLFESYHGIRRGCGEEVISMAVLADLDRDWWPSEYRHELLGCEVLFKFPCCKLLELLPRIENDFSLPALAAKAQIAALKTSRDPDNRRKARWLLTRSLYEHGYSKAAVAEAYRLIAWMMRLPERQALIFRQQLIEFEKERHMPYLTDTEEIAIEQGKIEGRHEGRLEGIEEGKVEAQRAAIVDVLEVRFRRVPESLRGAIRGIEEPGALNRLLRTAITCSDIEAFENEI